MKRYILFCIVPFLALAGYVGAGSMPGSIGTLVEEADGSPSGYAYKIKFPNGTVTSIINGIATLSSTLGGGNATVTQTPTVGRFAIWRSATGLGNGTVAEMQALVGSGSGNVTTTQNGTNLNLVAYSGTKSIKPSGLSVDASGNLLLGTIVAATGGKIISTGPTTGNTFALGSNNTKLMYCIEGADNSTSYCYAGADNQTSGTRWDKYGNLRLQTSLASGFLKVSSGELRADTNGSTLVSFGWDGGGSAFAANLGKRCKRMKYPATITGYSLVQSGNATGKIKLYKGAFSTSALPSTDLTGGNNVTITYATGKIDDTLSGWTTAVSAGDVICANATSNSNATWSTLTLHGTR